MRIIWNPNPLLTAVDLDDADKKLLWHQVKVHVLEERISEAYFDLDPEHQKWCRDALKDRCPVDFVAEAQKSLDYPFICGDEKRNDKTFDEYITEHADVYAAELLLGHSGDCTCVPGSCLKCHAEAMIGVDTIPGLGKHEASYIGSASGGRTIDEAIVYLRDYRPIKGKGWERHTDDEYNAHVPRWIEEAKRAHVWLVEYQREHFAQEVVAQDPQPLRPSK